MTRRLVVDANRVYSALLKDGETRRAMMQTGAVLFAPRFLRVEIEKHKAEIVRRARGRIEDVEGALAILYRHIAWVSDEDLAPHADVADAALGGVDGKDVPYLACALAVKADAIWSHDLDFDKQSLIPRVAHPEAETSRGEAPTTKGKLSGIQRAMPHSLRSSGEPAETLRRFQRARPDSNRRRRD